jgi:phosphoribosylformylglycinamidine cyclo-ligase
VGTKLKLAFIANKHDTIGQCLVNHCTNDILAVGARPLFFLDYFAAGKLDVDVFEDVVSGLAKACRENDCALIGGETAEMPDFYKPGDYDISGTIVGVAEKGDMMPNRGVHSGDLLIGLPSTGLHTNGYSLARKVLLEHYDSADFVESLNATIGDALLAIHRSYLPALDGILHEEWLVGISHVTGGGIVDNTRRILGEDQDLAIDWNCWDRPPIFTLIQELGNVPEDDMRHSMNLGIGLILIIKPDGLSVLQTHLSSQGEPYIQLGTVK